MDIENDETTGCYRSRRVHRIVPALATAFAWFIPMTGAVAAGQPESGKVDYNFAIRPILSDRCFRCHGPDEGARKADLRLDRAESAFEAGVIVPHKPEESEVVSRITATDDSHMPPKSSNLTLSDDEIALIRRWIAEGAEYKPHWAFLPLPDAVSQPETADTFWPANPIDRFILARLEREDLKPSPPASKEEWLRRVTFDLTGLPPAMGDIEAFLSDDTPQAYERVADRLLASPRFGERMAMEWLDVARFADSFGYQADGDASVWPWRDWVIKSYNENLPLDEFITWQVAGDRIPNATREQRLATAFNRLNRMTNEGGSIAEEWRNEYVSDRVHTLGTAFLGLTLECSRCHDHKFDPVTMKDYYGLGAFFNSIDEWGTYANAAFRPTPTLPLPTPEQELALAALRQSVKEEEEDFAETLSASEEAFREWLGRETIDPSVPGLGGDYPLDDVQGGRLENRADPEKPGKSSTANTPVPGTRGQALEFTGDDAAEFPGTPARVERGQPFTAAFWLRMPEVLREGVVFHRSVGTDVGIHGTELSFDDGRLFFGLIRFWPGNAIAIRTRLPLPTGKWVHVAASYDGSGRAGGLHVYLDGLPAETDVVRDRLTKNVEAAGGGFVFGERFRAPGLKGGRVDELRLYGRELTPVEVAHQFDGKALIEAIRRRDLEALRPYYFGAVDPEVAKARTDLQEARNRLFAAETEVFEVMTMEDMPEPRPAYVLARGSYDAPKDKPVGRVVPAFLPPFPEDAPRDRLGLARWLTDPGHPLTARVSVNRFWQLFFGRGIVATADNFGQQGALPTHPDLLDWLARHFVSSGWDLKRLCRTIVLSSTYRQRSAADPSLRERDPDNLLLARGPGLRLSAEMLRDAAFAASGLLVERTGGPPVKPPLPPGLWRGQNAFLPEYVADQGPAAYRRSLYTFWRRTSPPPNMLALDAASREVCVVRRQVTTTPLQPLVLLNDPQFVEAAVALGERMLRQGGPSTADRVTFAFRLAATRRPSDGERALLERLFADQLTLFRGEPEGARRFLETAGHAPPEGHDPAELAAAAVTASVILNLDAAVTTR